MQQVGSLFVELKAKTDDFQRGMKQARNELASFGQYAEDMSGSLSAKGIEDFGKSLTKAMIPVGIAMAAGVKTAADFEDSLTEIKARAGLTGDELAQVTKLALQMGAKTRYSAKQAADAMLQLVTGGMDAKTAMQALPGVLNAAAAEGLNLAFVADSVTDVMSAFGLSANKAAYVGDLLAKASGSSTATMEGLFQGISNVAGVSKQFGLSLEDTVAALAIFSDRGIKGAEAGTQLKSMLLNMYRPVDEVRGAWEQLGVQLYTADGRMRPLNTVLSEMNTALGKLDDEKRNEILQKIGGSFGILGLNALLAAGGTAAMTTQMGKATGAADMAAQKMATTTGKVESLRSTIEGIVTKAFTPFNENVAKPFIENLDGIAKGVEGIVDENPKLVGGLLSLAGAALLAGPGLTIVGKGMAFMGISGLGAAGGVMLLTAKLGLLGIAFGALVEIVQSKMFADMLNTWRGNFDNLGIIIDKTWQKITGVNTTLEKTGMGDVGKLAEWEQKAGGQVSQRGQANVQVKGAIDRAGAWAQGARNFGQTVIDLAEGFSQGDMLKVDMTGLERLWNTIADVADRELTKKAAAKATADYMATQGGYGSTGIGVTAGKLAGLESDMGTGGKSALPSGENVKAKEKEVADALDRMAKKADETIGEKGTVVASADKGSAAMMAIITTRNLQIADAFASLTPKMVTPFTSWLTSIGKLLMSIGSVPGLSQLFQVGAGIMSAIQGMGQMESRDSGGRGQAGKPYMIGTGAQPEMFVPDTAGSFYPARQLARMGGGAGGGGPITVQLQLDGNTIYQTVVDQDRMRNFPVWN